MHAGIGGPVQSETAYSFLNCEEYLTMDECFAVM